MQLEVRALLFDVQEACCLLGTFTAGKTFSDYCSDPLLRSAVERQFEIIGEALNKAVKLDKGLVSQISECKKIIAFRNFLIHAYALVSDDSVWNIIETRLSILQDEVAKLLANQPRAKAARKKKPPTRRKPRRKKGTQRDG
jgi:uncharacterized protein with HEPN domain